jgi:ribonuclease HI
VHPLRRVHELVPVVLGAAFVRRSGGDRQRPPLHLRFPGSRRRRAARDPRRQGRRLALPDDLQLRGRLSARHPHHPGNPRGLLRDRGATRLSRPNRPDPRNRPNDPAWQSLWDAVGARRSAEPEQSAAGATAAAANGSSPPRRFVVRTDGAARGNPGPASLGVVLVDAATPGARRPDASPYATISEYLGVQTNNVAEYTGLLRALALAEDLGARELDLLLDSQLIVEQLHGRWKVKDAKLRPLWEEARARLAAFERWSARHVRRAENHAADALANEAIDRVGAGGPAAVVRRPG